MSLNLLYSVREGFEGLRRARFATLLTISTIGITLTLFGIFSIYLWHKRRSAKRSLLYQLLMKRIDNQFAGHGTTSTLYRRKNRVRPC